MPKGETSRPTNRKRKEQMKSADKYQRYAGKMNAEGDRLARQSRADTENNAIMAHLHAKRGK